MHHLRQSLSQLNLPSLNLPTPEDPYQDIQTLCLGQIPTARSITMFFDFIEHHTLDQHSQYRREFWQECLKAQHITQSWLILASPHPTLPSHQYANLAKSKRVDDTHAVLLMRVRNLIVAEWSHTGKCRFWHALNPHAPIMFAKTYTRETLVNGADYIQQHYFSAKGLWQKDAKRWLKEHADVSAF